MDKPVFNLTSGFNSGGLISPNVNTISETLSSLIMSRPQTHQNQLKPSAQKMRNIKTLTRIQSVESKNFMSQRTQLQNLSRATTSNAQQKLQLATPSTENDIQDHANLQSNSRFQSLTRGDQSTSSNLNKNLKIDLQKLQEYKSLIDQKERTISDLRFKLKFNESKTSLGGTTAINLRSNLMKADYLMNFRINENTDITELKRVLITLISETQQTHEILLNRCNKVREMLDLYEARIQFDDMLFLKEKDVQRMNEHIKHLTDSLVNASKNELILNEKLREQAKCKHDLAMTRSRNEFLERQNQLLTQEIKDLKHQMVNMKELEMQMNKQRVADSNQLQVMTRRLDTLEKGLEVFQDNRKAKPDDEYKLKNTVNFLIRETQELKKEIQLKKKTIENKDREIQKLLSKIQKFLQAKNDDGYGDDDEFYADQMDMGKMNNDHQTTITGSLVTQIDGIYDGSQGSQFPQVLRYHEAKKNIEYRFKSLNANDKATMTELIESGSQFFVDYLINKGDIVQVKDKFKFISDQLLKSNKFIDKLNSMMHFGLSNHRKDDEKQIIQSYSVEGLNILDKAQRINLWIKDTLNNELWTYFGEKRIQFESTIDIIGYCCTSGHTIAVKQVKESHLFDQDYENVLQELEPYSYKERQFVLALPIKHPRKDIILGVLEICFSRQATLDDYYLADSFAQITGLLFSGLHNHRRILRLTYNFQKMVESSVELVEAIKISEQKLGETIEKIVKDIFGIQNIRFIFIENAQCYWYTDDLKKISEKALALEVSEEKLGKIFGEPQQEKSYNGNIDINTNLPLVCYPIFDYFFLAEKKVLGVIEIPQPQLRFKGHSKTKIKDMIIDDVMRETLDGLSKLISSVLNKK